MNESHTGGYFCQTGPRAVHTAYCSYTGGTGKWLLVSVEHVTQDSPKSAGGLDAVCLAQTVTVNTTCRQFNSVLT
jgi:hypothetical protein